MGLTFSERVRRYQRKAARLGREALVDEIARLERTSEGLDHTGKPVGTGTEGNSVSLLRTRADEVEVKLLAAEEALAKFDAGESIGSGGRTVVVDRSLNRSVS